MNDKRNPFGGKNPHGMYVPMTDEEIEVLHRIAEAGEFRVVIKGEGQKGESIEWGYVTGFKIGAYPGPGRYQGEPIVTIGDKRLTFFLRMNFNAPALPQPNWFFDMEVHAMGKRFFAQRFPTANGGNPIQVCAGMFHDFALDVAIDQIDPAIVKAVKPKAIGLTTRHGNMHLNVAQQRLLAKTQAGEQAIRQITAEEARKATADKKKGTAQ
jgi:hypothetical protein